MAEQRVAELVLRGRDAGAVRPVKELTKAVDDLSAKLADQIVAAERGEISLKGLETTYKALQDVTKDLASSQGLIATFKDQAGRVEKANAVLAKYRAEYDALKAKQTESNTLSRTEEAALARKNRQVEAAAAALKRQEEALAGTAGKLREAGVDTNNLAAAESKIAQASRQVTSDLAATKSALTVYQAEAQKAAAANQRFADSRALMAQLDEGRRIVRQSQYVGLFAEAIEKQEEATRRAAAATAQAAKVQRDVEAAAIEKQKEAAARAAADNALAAKAQRDIEAFRRIADQSVAASRGYLTFGTASVQAARSAGTIGRSLTEIVSPATIARQSIQGLESETLGLSRTIEAIKGQVTAYAETMRQLGAAQRSVVAIGERIDVFKGQVDSIRTLRAAQREARSDFLASVAAIRAAKAPSDELADANKRAEAALKSTTIALRDEIAAARESQVALRAAGVQTNDLSKSTAQLEGIAKRTATSVDRLNAAQQGVSPTGAGRFLGLRPYELQNLGFQINDIITQLGSGTSLAQTLAQQGGQIVQVFGPRAFAFIGRFAPLFAAVAAAAFVAFQAINRIFELNSAAREFQAALIATADGVKVTAAELTKAQNALDKYGLSFKQAGDAVRQFLREDVRPERLIELGRAAQNTADVFKIDVVDAAKQISVGLTGGYEAVKKLDESFRFLNAGQAEYIKQLFAAGQGEAARAAATEAFIRRQDEAASKARGPWTNAVRDFQAAWTDVLNFLANSAVSRAAVFMARGLATALQGVLNLATTGNVAGDGKGGDQDVAKIIAARDQLVGLQEKLQKFEASPTAGGDQRERALALLRSQVAEAETAFKTLTEARRKDVRAAQDQVKADGVRDDSTEAAIKRSKEYQAELKRQLAEQQAINKFTTKSEIEARIRAKGDEERKKSQAANLPDAVVAENVRLVEAAERRRIDDQLKTMAEGVGEKIGAIERELQNALRSLASAGAKQLQADLELRLAAIDQNFEKIQDTIKRFRAAGGSAIGGKPIAAFEAEARAAVDLLKTTEQLKFYEESINAALKERDDTYKEINERVAAGTTTAAEGLKESITATERLTPRIRELAVEAFKFAESLRGGIVPDARLEAFIARIRRASTSATATGEPGGAFGRQQRDTFAAGEQKINDILRTRADLVRTQNELVEAGVITQSEAQGRIKAFYDATGESLNKAIVNLEQFVEQLRAAGVAPEIIDLMTAKLELFRAQAVFVSADFTRIKTAIEESFGQGFGTFFNAAAEAVANLISGFRSFKQTLADVGRAALTFFASFLQAIANAIVQVFALRAAQSLLSFAGLGGSGGGIAGSIAGAVAHEGMVVGEAPRTTRRVPVSWFANAPRYHAGTVVGLSDNEQLSILEKGEEVLSKDNPRNILNGGDRAGGPGSAAAPTNVKVINAIDPASFLSEGLNSTVGEKTFLNFIRANSSAIRNAMSL